MVNWQRILWDLRRHYKPVAAIAREIDMNHKWLQKIAKDGVKTDISYHNGVKLLELHEKHCVGKMGQLRS